MKAMRMKKRVAAVAALFVLSVFSAERKESPFKALDEARVAFNKQEGEVFRGIAAADYRTLSDAERFDTAAGTGRWVIALPLKNDARVRFIKAEFKGGAFVSGEMRKLGLKPEKVDAKAFAALREDFAMLAVRSDATGKDRTCAFYPAGKVGDAQQNHLIRYGVAMHVDPNGRYLSGLCGIDRPLGVSMKDVKYAYSLMTPDGDVLDMGTMGDGNKMTPVMREKLEALHPEKKGLYSDRDIVDMYCEGFISYRPVK